MTSWSSVWPSGRTWVFQGTVAEDATGGTHSCTLEVIPGAGSELMVLYGQVMVGNTATAQTALVLVKDGSGANNLGFLLNSEQASATTASLVYPFPVGSTTAVIGAATETQVNGFPNCIVSGTMALQLRVITAAVSVTQTFAVVCRIKGGLPTATLADSVGTPVLTTNTNLVF